MEYVVLVDLYEKLEKTTKRLEKTYYMSKLLRNTTSEDIDRVMLLLQGRVFPRYDERKIGVASRLVIQAIKKVSGLSEEKVENDWKKSGDLGITVYNLLGRKQQASLFSWNDTSRGTLSVEYVFDTLQKLATLEGQGTIKTKVDLIAGLLNTARAKEAKYITKTVLEELRVGVGEGMLRDALVWSSLPPIVGVFYKCSGCGGWVPRTEKCLECAQSLEQEDGPGKVHEFESPEELKDLDNSINEYEAIFYQKNPRKLYDYAVALVQEAIDVSNDFGKVAAVLKKKGMKGLQDIKLTPGIPIKVMLAQKVENVENGFERVGKPAHIEYKYDGFRMQVHKFSDTIKIFTRRLEDVTEQFPDAVDFVKRYVDGKSFVLDAEAVGYDKNTKKYLPFQSISQRIKRKYDIDEMSRKFPVEINVFDIMEFEGKSMIKETFEDRRKLLSGIVSSSEMQIGLAKQIITGSVGEAGKFYNEALDSGNEGVVFKRSTGVYRPGLRVGEWVKLKPVMDPLDLVIIGAEWGEGKRSRWLTSYIVACQDDNGNLFDVGKVSTGVKELEGQGLTYAYMTEQLKPLVQKEKGKSVEVKPELVVEVNYEEIQKSPTYSSGYALRFPRVVRLREDRGLVDIATIEFVEELYYRQK